VPVFAVSDIERGSSAKDRYRYIDINNKHHNIKHNKHHNVKHNKHHHHKLLIP